MFRKNKPAGQPDLIEDNWMVDTYLDLVMLIKVTAILYVIFREVSRQTKDFDVVGTAKTIYLGVNLATTVYGRYRNQVDHQRTVKPIEKEKRYTEKAFHRIGIANTSRLRRLKLVYTADTNKAETHINIRVQNKFMRESLATLSWTPGKAEIVNQVAHADYIFNHLPREVLKQCQDIEPPWFTKTWLQLVPYANQAFKTSAKTRSIVLPLVTANAIDLLYGIATNTLPFSRNDILSSCVAATMMLMYATESYILSDRHIRMSFEGYHRISGYFFSRRPTCLGQQINSELLFYPNAKLRLAADYIVRAHNALVKLAQKGELHKYDLPMETIDKINNFFLFMQTHSNMSGLHIEAGKDIESQCKLD